MMLSHTSRKHRREGYVNPIPTTDIIIEYEQDGKEGIVLITRRNPPYGLALPGGFHELGISSGENARKEAKEETGLDILIEDETKPFAVYSRPDRDPRDHMISITYVARGSGELRAGDDAAGARLYSFNELCSLLGKSNFAFDHEYIIRDYLKWKDML